MSRITCIEVLKTHDSEGVNDLSVYELNKDHLQDPISLEGDLNEAVIQTLNITFNDQSLSGRGIYTMPATCFIAKDGAIWVDAEWVYAIADKMGD